MGRARRHQHIHMEPVLSNNVYDNGLINLAERLPDCQIIMNPFRRGQFPTIHFCVVVHEPVTILRHA